MIDKRIMALAEEEYQNTDIAGMSSSTARKRAGSCHSRRARPAGALQRHRTLALVGCPALPSKSGGGHRYRPATIRA